MYDFSSVITLYGFQKVYINMCVSGWVPGIICTAWLSPTAVWINCTICVLLMGWGQNDRCRLMWCVVWHHIDCCHCHYSLDKPLVGIKMWGNKPRSLNLLLSTCQPESLFSQHHIKPVHSMLPYVIHHHHIWSCPLCSRPVPGAVLPMLRGPPAVAGPAGAQAGTAWDEPHLSNARSGSLGSGGLSFLGRVAQALKKGKMGKKGAVGWWRMMTLLWPGQTPCLSLKEGLDTEEWNLWRHGALWIYPLMLCCR